jgi:hypothetical protein
LDLRAQLFLKGRILGKLQQAPRNGVCLRAIRKRFNNDVEIA